MTLQQILDELDELHRKADMRSRMIVENGREIPDVERAKSEGYADAYSFCLLRLREYEFHLYHNQRGS